MLDRRLCSVLPLVEHPVALTTLSGAVEVVAGLLPALAFEVGELVAAPVFGDGGVDVAAQPLT